MSSIKKRGEKIKLIAFSKKRRPAPFWASLRKFGQNRAATRRIRSATKHWRRGRIKV